MKFVEQYREFWNRLIMELKLSGCAKKGPVLMAICPEIPSPSFNHVANIGGTDENIDGLLDDLSVYFKSKKIPFISFKVDPSGGEDTLSSLFESRGFCQEINNSVLVFQGEIQQENVFPHFKIVQIAEDELSLFNQMLLEIYEMPSEYKKGFDHLNRQRMRMGVLFYIAYINGRPVGTCGLFSSNGMAEIFAVGTVKELRGKGIASTMIFSVLRNSHKLGNKYHIVRADVGSKAERLYAKLGFVIDHTIAFYVKQENLEKCEKRKIEKLKKNSH
jgi:RimJ/RimL family protein N-acetyltransferase